MRFIKEQIIPQKIDCVQCLDAEPGALRNRSWKGVKDYIRNRITALQSGRRRRDPDASTSSKTKKQRVAPDRRKGGVNEAVPQSNTPIVQQGGGLQQYNTQISSQGKIPVVKAALIPLSNSSQICHSLKENIPLMLS